MKESGFPHPDGPGVRRLYRSFLNLAKVQKKRTRAEKLLMIARGIVYDKEQPAGESSPSISGITPLGRPSSPEVEEFQQWWTKRERAARKTSRKKRSPPPAKSPSGSPPPRTTRKKGRGRARPPQEGIRAPPPQASASRSPRAEVHGDGTPPAAEKSAE
jgi:hypothetical protein